MITPRTAAAVVLSSLTIAGSAFAYSDVPRGAWYEQALDSLTESGHLDASQTLFRPDASATRAEFLKLLVELRSGLFSAPPAVSSFDDVPTTAWFFPYMEEAAKEQWIKGDGNCLGAHPCFARPSSSITRGEAAVLIVRAFGLEPTGDAPRFTDNPEDAWYAASIQTMHDQCLLTGDDATGRVRPNDLMNRAEMAMMLYRTDQVISGGADCWTVTPPPESSSSSSSVQSSSSSEQAASSSSSSSSSATPLSQLEIRRTPGDEPSTTTIRRGANAIPFLRLDATSSCDKASTIAALTIGHSGSGSAFDIVNLEAFTYGKRAGGSTFDARAYTWRLTLDPPLTVPACATVTIDLRADLATKAQPGSNHALVLAFPADVVSDPDAVLRSFPIIGPLFSIK